LHGGDTADFDHISWREFRESDGIEDWRNLSGGATAMFRTSTFMAATRFAAGIATLPGAEDQRPSIDIRHDGVTVRLLTRTETYRGMSRRDVELARAISALARRDGLVADPSAVQSLLVYIGTPGPTVLPFWRAVLAYQAMPGDPEDGVLDPHGRDPTFWVEPMDEARSDGSGAIHVAIWVPHEQAEARVAAALAAGGRLVRDTEAPAWWTLADPAGNEVDIATTLGRD
jgi:4a-hydroxytetrahydrobiopterin dehydratase